MVYCAGEAVKRAGLAYDHPVRALLERSAEITGVRQAVVRVPNESGQLVTLDDRIVELKSDPRYSSVFPQPERMDIKGDMEKLSENFDAIASGKIAVE
jgi:hypothetical protein